MDLDSLERYDSAMAKITADLNELDGLPHMTENFSSFPSKIPEPKFPEELNAHIYREVLGHRPSS